MSGGVGKWIGEWERSVGDAGEEEDEDDDVGGYRGGCDGLRRRRVGK